MYEFDGTRMYLSDAYQAFLRAALAAIENDNRHVVRHDELFAVFELLVGDMPKTKTKLSKRLGHQHLSIEPHTQGSSSIRGLAVTWKAEPGQAAEWRGWLEGYRNGRPPGIRTAEESQDDTSAA